MSMTKPAKPSRPPRKTTKRTNRKVEDLPPPYVGLRYFGPKQAKLFAARDDDVEKCAREFNEARILILHGTTGCGKSSFLRAGLKPYVELMNGGKVFDEADGELPVIRSGEDPLERIARKMFDDISKCEAHYAKEENRLLPLAPWGYIKGRIREAKLDATDWLSFRAKTTGRNAARLSEAIRRYAGAVDVCPVIVIDQAEEVFTGETTLANEEQMTAGKRAEREARTNEYFIFLRAFAESETRARLIISLRTEYKGQFDDKLRAYVTFSGTQHAIRGFHLPDLETAKLVEAIKRPASLPEYNLSFEDGAPEKIARALESIPIGGRLPVMQVACLRLWQKERDRLDWAAKHQKSAATGIHIRAENIDELGPMDKQIDQFLRESFARMYREFNTRGGDVPDYVAQFDDWMRLLRVRLVELQADGRATTRRISNKELSSDANKALQGDCHNTDEALTPEQLEKEKPELFSEFDWLALDRVGILRKDVQDNPTGRGKQAAWWMLGHDSVGLALERWRLIFGNDSMSMMKMDARARTSKDAKLFVEPLETWSISVPEELLWDRYLIQLAMNPDGERVRPDVDLASRLGLHLVEAPELRALKDHEDQGLSWKSLLSAMEKQRKSGHHVLFLCERNNIAGFQEELGVDPNDWKDIAIADAFYGNALIGPVIFQDEGDSADGTRLSSDMNQARRDTQDRVAKVLDYLVEQDVEILCFDISAQTMVQLALSICGRDPANISKIKFRLDDSITLPNHARDFLFAKMQRANREAAETKSSKKTFIIGSDYGRAVAKQTGHRVHFSLLDLTSISRNRENTKKGYLRMAQRSVTHTVWNLGYPPNAAVSEALELRIASLAYHVTNRIRSQPDDFVRLVHKKHENLELRRGFTLSREVVRDTIRDCFDFHHFEDYGFQFYRKDSEQRYWVEEDPRYAAKRSRDIYFRLLELRGAANQKFKTYEEIVRTTEPSAQVRTLNECAWNNYLIFNFYDAERQITQAVRLLQK